MKHNLAINKEYYNADESWKHYAKCKEPDTKGLIFYASIYKKYA